MTNDPPNPPNDPPAPLTMDAITAVIATSIEEALKGYDGRVSNTVNAAVTAHLRRTQGQGEKPQGNEGKDQSAHSKEISALRAEIEAERAERAKQDTSNRQTNLKHSLTAALAAKGVVGAKARAVVNDMVITGQAGFDETGTPVIRVSRVRAPGASPREATYSDPVAAIEDWSLTSDAKDFLPAPVATGGSGRGANNGRGIPAKENTKHDLGSVNGALRAATEILSNKE